MAYPDDRYPTVPSFPRPKTSLTTQDMSLMDRDWYEVVCSYIEDMVIEGTENQTIRHDGNSWKATDILKVYTDGAEITTDHPLDGSFKVLGFSLLVEGTADPDVSSSPDGYIVLWYEA
jgi:hypothetical protein